MSDFSTGSTAQPNEALRHIYDLILNDQQAAALDQLKPYVAQHPDDAEGWWLMANAVPDIPGARTAIENVLRIEPTHQQAQELLNQLDAAEAEQYFNTDLFSDLPSSTPAAVVAPADSSALDTPDWLKDFGSPAASPDMTTTPATEVPDWLKAMDSTDSSPAPLSADTSFAATPLAGDPLYDDSMSVGGQTRQLSDVDLSSWFTAPTANQDTPVTPVFDQSTRASTPATPFDDMDLTGLFDEPVGATPAVSGAPGESLSDADLSSWFDVPADQVAVPSIDEEAAAVPAGALPDWLMAAEPVETTPVNVEPAHPVIAPLAPAQASTPIPTPISEPPDIFLIPEMAALNKTLDAASLPADWLTADDPFAPAASVAQTTAIKQPTTTPTAIIEQDVVPSFVEQGAVFPPAARTPSNIAAARDFSVRDEEGALPDLIGANVGKETTVAATSARATTGTGNAMPPIQPIQRPIEPARRFPLALLLLLLLIVIAAIVLIPRFITQAPPAPTTNAVAVVATDLATVSSVATSLATDVPTQDLNGQATNILATATGMAAQVQTGIATSMINATALTEVAALPTNATAVSTSALAATGTVTGVTTQSTTGGSLDTLIAALPAQLSAAGIPTATVAVKDSSLGKALTISYCQPFGPNMQKNAYSAMDVLAAQVASFAGQADALAIEVHGCGAAAPIEYRAIVPVAQAVAYTSKQIDVHQFRASWRTN